MPPVVWTVLMSSLSRFLVLEQASACPAATPKPWSWSRVTCAGWKVSRNPIAGVPETWVVHQFRSEQSTPLGPSLDTTTTPSTARSQ